jgi:hypothetical protein
LNDYVREHITHGYAVTVHSAQGVTADTTHAVLSENTTRRTDLRRHDRGREANTVYLYQRSTENEHRHESTERTISRDEATASTLRDCFARSSPTTSARSPPMTSRPPRPITRCLTMCTVRSGTAEQRFATAPRIISDGAPQQPHSTTQLARLNTATSARIDQ